MVTANLIERNCNILVQEQVHLVAVKHFSYSVYHLAFSNVLSRCGKRLCLN